MEQDDRLPFQGLPLVIVFAPSPTLLEKELLRLKEEGANLSASLQCPFLDVSRALQENKSSVDSQFAPEKIEESLRALIENIRHRSGLLKICKNSAGGVQGTNETEPDIR